VDPACYVISLNIHRRHLTKEQQAELIVKAIEAGRPTNDSAKVARSFSPSLGKRGGSTKDPVLRQAVEEGAKHEISARTIKRARAKVAGKVAAPRRKPATRPSAQPAKDARPHTPGDRVLPAPAPPPAIEPREPRIQGTAPKRPEGCRELAQRFIADVGRMVEPMIEDGHRAGAVEVVKDISCYTVAALNSLLERLHREDPERLAPPPAQSAGVA
jgi:hypothetical protein